MSLAAVMSTVGGFLISVALIFAFFAGCAVEDTSSGVPEKKRVASTILAVGGIGAMILASLGVFILGVW
jgi:hypothetical protein